jgi:hypothetical protein
MNLITTHRLFRRIFVCGLCLLLTAIFPAKNAHSQTMQSMASYQGKDREQKLMEAAQKEGSLLLYTAMPREYVLRLNEPFEKKYGIKVKVWQAVGESILQRVLNESRSAPVVDVVHSTSTYLTGLVLKQNFRFLLLMHFSFEYQP